MASQVLIGVDPGTVDLGFCLFRGGELQATEKLHVPQSWELNRRINSLLTELAKVHYRLTGLTDEIVVAFEKPVYMEGTREIGGVQFRTARPINQLWMFVGALGFWALERSYQVIGYDVPDIKESIGGAKSASKELVQAALQAEFFAMDHALTDHEWDALAVARHHQLRQNLGDREIQGDPRARGET